MNGDRSEPGSVRAHLLDEEPINVGRQEQLQQEIDAMFVQNLTRSTRVSWIVSLVVCIAGAMFGVMLIKATHVPPAVGSTGMVRGVWCLFTLSMVVSAIFSAFVLYRGKLDVRGRFDRGRFNAVLALSCACLLAVQAATHPTIPNLAWSVFALLFVVVAVANRVNANIKISELRTRESILRLELKLNELSNAR